MTTFGEFKKLGEETFTKLILQLYQQIEEIGLSDADKLRISNDINNFLVANFDKLSKQQVEFQKKLHRDLKNLSFEMNHLHASLHEPNTLQIEGLNLREVKEKTEAYVNSLKKLKDARENALKLKKDKITNYLLNLNASDDSLDQITDLSKSSLDTLDSIISTLLHHFEEKEREVKQGIEKITRYETILEEPSKLSNDFHNFYLYQKQTIIENIISPLISLYQTRSEQLKNNKLVIEKLWDRLEIDSSDPSRSDLQILFNIDFDHIENIQIDQLTSKTRLSRSILMKTSLEIVKLRDHFIKHFIVIIQKYMDSLNNFWNLIGYTNMDTSYFREKYFLSDDQLNNPNCDRIIFPFMENSIEGEAEESDQDPDQYYNQMEEVIAIFENQQKELEKEYNEKLILLKEIISRMELQAEKEKLNGEISTMTSRAGVLLQNLKQQKRIQTRLEKNENNLMKLITKWEKENGKSFNYGGVRFLESLTASSKGSSSHRVPLHLKNANPSQQSSNSNPPPTPSSHSSMLSNPKPTPSKSNVKSTSSSSKNSLSSSSSFSSSSSTKTSIAPSSASFSTFASGLKPISKSRSSDSLSSFASEKKIVKKTSTNSNSSSNNFIASNNNSTSNNNNNGNGVIIPHNVRNSSRKPLTTKSSFDQTSSSNSSSSNSTLSSTTASKTSSKVSSNNENAKNQNGIRSGSVVTATKAPLLVDDDQLAEMTPLHASKRRNF